MSSNACVLFDVQNAVVVSQGLRSSSVVGFVGRAKASFGANVAFCESFLNLAVIMCLRIIASSLFLVIRFTYYWVFSMCNIFHRGLKEDA